MMPSNEKVIAVVPAFNEAKMIGSVVESIRSHVSEVIVVDDCSADATREEAARRGAVVLSHTENRGYDASLNDGFAEAARRGADIIVSFDADGEHDPEDISRVLSPILGSNADISIGMRPRARHIAERLFASYTFLKYGIRDPLCGLKAYRRAIYQRVGFFDSVRSIGTELLIRGAKMGVRITSVPVALRNRKDGFSRFYAARLRGNLKILRALSRVMCI